VQPAHGVLGELTDERGSGTRDGEAGEADARREPLGGVAFGELLVDEQRTRGHDRAEHEELGVHPRVAR